MQKTDALDDAARLLAEIREHMTGVEWRLMRGEVADLIERQMDALAVAFALFTEEIDMEEQR